MREGGIDLDQVPSYLTLFTGPHGSTAPVSDYETVVMIASSYSIASQLPYLKQLLYSQPPHSSGLAVRLNSARWVIRRVPELRR
ncbi:hypothetical protein K505DRAFT_260391 [Melanomma pulvis-pyrius CBS 109.77]|uniref:Uncharacterized protein n=1 Tax=Melanomma pulvis-pyrius CBS 109.77 TaxID=1314802 RepID=A0A6A6WQI9_9PLEO|nr:hypothetical protein K505DRAFT_260391 [Melanomma pulvis-pyrius CBS 109.77]